LSWKEGDRLLQPNVTPNITLTKNQAINLLLDSISMEELGLSHIINVEAEKIQDTVGTLPELSNVVKMNDLLLVNNSIKKTLQAATMKEIFLKTKLDHVLEGAELITETTALRGVKLKLQDHQSMCLLGYVFKV